MWAAVVAVVQKSAERATDVQIPLRTSWWQRASCPVCKDSDPLRPRSAVPVAAAARGSGSHSGIRAVRSSYQLPTPNNTLRTTRLIRMLNETFRACSLSRLCVPSSACFASCGVLSRTAHTRHCVTNHSARTCATINSTTTHSRACCSPVGLSVHCAAPHVSA